MSGKILHLLSQRPGRTGSGVTLDAVVRLANRAGWQQAAILGVPSGETYPRLGTLPSSNIHPVFFSGETGDETAPINFPVPGMSDVMPYHSSVWSTLSEVQLETYRQTWRDHLLQIIDRTAPDLIHTNHIWLMSSLVRDLAPDLPLVATCHATGLRQMELCPHLAQEVIAGCAHIDHFCVLRRDHRQQLARILGIDRKRVTVTGVGYREDLFYEPPTNDSPPTNRAEHLLYIGKYSAAKGLPWLLDAVQELARSHPGLRLHVAGSGAGPEAEALRKRMEALTPLVVRHGQLDQHQLADLMRRCGICVLPSFYEGVPLVLVEAAACGCHLVATELPGVVEQIAPHLADHLILVRLPRLKSVDQPRDEDLPAFVADLQAGLESALSRLAIPPEKRTGPKPDPSVYSSSVNNGSRTPDLESFTWTAVFQRIEAIWRDLLIHD